MDIFHRINLHDATTLINKADTGCQLDPNDQKRLTLMIHNIKHEVDFEIIADEITLQPNRVKVRYVYLKIHQSMSPKMIMTVCHQKTHYIAYCDFIRMRQGKNDE